jgi:hypothetical protein
MLGLRFPSGAPRAHSRDYTRERQRKLTICRNAGRSAGGETGGGKLVVSFSASHRPVAGHVQEQQHVLAVAQGRQVGRRNAIDMLNVARSRPSLSRPSAAARAGTMGAMRFMHIGDASGTHGSDK